MGWNEWWLAIQPSWRGSAWPLNMDTPSDGNEDWATLRRGGPNGIFLVVIALAWWLAEAIEAGEALDNVKRAVNDVEWVLTRLTAPTKRSRANTNTRPAKRVCK